MEVKIFKLFSGEEVVARLDEIIPGVGYKVTKPMLVNMFQNGQGQMGVMLIPWIAGNNESTTVIKEAAMAINAPAEPAAEFEKQYLQQTTSIKLA